MATHIALLRGINLGGRNRVLMPELRQVPMSLGYTDVTTYLQSGNLVFSSREADSATIAAVLEQAIAESLDLRVPVVVVSRDDLDRIVRANPYTAEPNPKLVHVVFANQDIGPDATAAVATLEKRAAERGSRDTARVTGRAVYLHTPGGFGRSELAALLMGRSSSPVCGGTARNWATVTKLLSLCDGS